LRLGHPLSLSSDELAKLLALCLGDLVWKQAVTQNVMVAVCYTAQLPEVETACFPWLGQGLMLACSRLLSIL